MSTLPPAEPGLGPALRRWFTTPPRRHGEVEEDRTVSFLELFYDLVFVVLVAQVAHTLAKDVSWSGVGDFAVVFGMIWIAWFNGSMYHEVHGREDGRSRSLIFIQMLILVVLAVFAAHATEEDGPAFAVTYAILLAVLAWQWWSVRRQDIEPAYRTQTARYVTGLLVSIAVVLLSAFVAEEARLLLWAALVVGWVVAAIVQGATSQDRQMGISATESMAERFGLFTIIVLGELVVGVVDGLIEAGPSALTIVTGLVALTIGFGFWWNYFDSIGRRVPRRGSGAFTTWLMAHLPLTAAITAAGAGMVSLIEHAGDDRTPAATAWLLAGSAALMMAFLALLVTTIDYEEDLAPIAPRFTAALLVGAVACLAIGLLQPQAWVLALLLSLVCSVVWFYGFALRAKAEL